MPTNNIIAQPKTKNHQLRQKSHCDTASEPGAKRGGGPGGARAVFLFFVFLGFDYGETDWVYVDVDELWHVVAGR